MKFVSAAILHRLPAILVSALCVLVVDLSLYQVHIIIGYSSVKILIEDLGTLDVKPVFMWVLLKLEIVNVTAALSQLLFKESCSTLL